MPSATTTSASSCGRVERYDEAVAAYAKAIELDPTHANAYNNLGVLRRFTGKPAEAEAAYRKAIELKPTYAEAYHNLGVLLTGQKRHREAILCYFKVLSLEPARTDDRRLLAIAYCEIGQRDKAIEIFENWIKEDPDSPVAHHMLAAVSGRNVPARASDAYVELSFDGFAESFERKLEQLSYRAPSLVAAAIEGSGLEAGGRARRARRRLRHRAVRTARQAVRAAAGRRRSVDRHAHQGAAEAGLRPAREKRIDALSPGAARVSSI